LQIHLNLKIRLSKSVPSSTNAFLKQEFKSANKLVSQMIDLLKTYLPGIITSINSDRKVLAKIGRFQKRYEALKLKLTRDGDSLFKPHSIYEWIVTAKSGDKRSIAFLEFINGAFCFCLEEVDPVLQSRVKLIGVNILTAFDTDVSLTDNPTYLTYLGELLTIHRVLNNKSKYRLLNIEISMPNGKRADFFLTDKDYNQNILVDTVSIVGFNPSVPKNARDLIKYFHGKFDQKMDSKMIAMPLSERGYILINEKPAVFTILPILWNEVLDLKRWDRELKSPDMQHPGSLPLSILITQQGSDGKYTFLFSTVEQALNTV
jgi:hypothetical protein